MNKVGRDKLRGWRDKMESFAKQHDSDAPVGYTPSTWPPFTIVDNSQIGGPGSGRGGRGVWGGL